MPSSRARRRTPPPTSAGRAFAATTGVLQRVGHRLGKDVGRPVPPPGSAEALLPTGRAGHLPHVELRRTLPDPPQHAGRLFGNAPRPVPVGVRLPSQRLQSTLPAPAESVAHHVPCDALARRFRCKASGRTVIMPPNRPASHWLGDPDTMKEVDRQAESTGQSRGAIEASSPGA